jgi:hypothetical protein
VGVQTLLKTTEEIYDEYPEGRDKPEQIKYFIKDAIETYGITYVLLVGGLKNIVWSKPRDNANEGTTGWRLPVRYNNFYDNPAHPLAETLYDPGVLTDLYFADIYDGEGNFSSWDMNNDGIFASWGMPGVAYNETEIDMAPDVRVGRLACENNIEVKNVVNKIINYEQTPADPSWYKKMIVVSGDGFLDQEDLNFQWNTSELPEGGYTIFAQSENDFGDIGVIEEINITIDRSVATTLTFNHNDNERVSSYPANPIAEIVSVSEGNILGNTDVFIVPSDNDAFDNSFYGWANVEFENGILHIRGKTYDPQPYGNRTNIHVWVNNEDDDIVFDDWRNGSEMYYEGEWITGERELLGGGGALYYMPEDFEREILWASNGKFTGEDDVIQSLSQGSGFALLSGHGSPNVWADHYPGVPGNRQFGSITGLRVTTIKAYPKFLEFPLFPMTKIKNKDKLPVVLIGGCHNSQFNVSMIPALINAIFDQKMWTYGQPVPECFSWYLIKMANIGAIATVGNTGLGYGSLGNLCTTEGLDGGICIEFFKQFGQKYDAGDPTILGDVYSDTLTAYVNTFDMSFLDHAKSLQQWELLGDPSLMLGGYPSS